MLKNFPNKKFNFVEFPSSKHKKCERIEGNSIGRLYKTEEGNIYPSITTVLSIQEKPELEQWKARVGEEEAKRVSLKATTNGTHIHNMAESYVLGTLDYKTANPLILDRFIPLKNKLDNHVDNIFSTELQFYSDKLKTAGTTDLIAEYDGILSVIDYKTSKRIKYANEIKDYFIQGSVYAMMAYEMFQLPVKDIVIIMIVEGGEILIFKEKVKNYMKDFISLRNKFKEKYNI